MDPNDIEAAQRANTAAHGVQGPNPQPPTPNPQPTQDAPAPEPVPVDQLIPELQQLIDEPDCPLDEALETILRKYRKEEQPAPTQGDPTQPEPVQPEEPATPAQPAEDEQPVTDCGSGTGGKGLIAYNNANGRGPNFWFCNLYPNGKPITVGTVSFDARDFAAAYKEYSTIAADKYKNERSKWLAAKKLVDVAKATAPKFVAKLQSMASKEQARYDAMNDRQKASEQSQKLLEHIQALQNLAGEIQKDIDAGTAGLNLFGGIHSEKIIERLSKPCPPRVPSDRQLKRKIQRTKEDAELNGLLGGRFNR